MLRLRRKFYPYTLRHLAQNRPAKARQYRKKRRKNRRMRLPGVHDANIESAGSQRRRRKSQACSRNICRNIGMTKFPAGTCAKRRLARKAYAHASPQQRSGADSFCLYLRQRERAARAGLFVSSPLLAWRSFMNQSRRKQAQCASHSANQRAKTAKYTTKHSLIYNKPVNTCIS